MDFTFSRHAYSTSIGEHRGSDDIVDTRRHITLWTYWMCRYVFCPCGIQITKIYLSLATRLNEGVNVYLNKLILASLYEALGHATEDLKRGVDIFQNGGRIWLLQLWVNSTFAHTLDIQIHPSTEVGAKGTRLAQLTSDDGKGVSKASFENYFYILYKCNTFEPLMAPFAARGWGTT